MSALPYANPNPRLNDGPANTKLRLEESANHYRAVRLRQLKRLEKIQAAISQTDAHLLLIADVQRALDGDWRPWTRLSPTGLGGPRCDSPLPQGALTHGVIKALKLTDRELTTNELTDVVYNVYGFPKPPPWPHRIVRATLQGALNRLQKQGLVRSRLLYHTELLWSLTESPDAV